MLETVRRVQEAIDLDLLILGIREAPEIFREFSGSRRPVEDTALWYGVLSDIEGLQDSDLVVNWRGEPSRGWGGWAEKGDAVEEAFRFACPNNPAVRRKAVRRLRELLGRYAFAGVFLDKIRFPSPANGVDEMLSCFCGHCRDAASHVDLDLDAVVKVLADRAIEPWAPAADKAGKEASYWLDALLAASPVLSRFQRFRADSVASLVAELADEAQRMGRNVSLDLFSPCLASLAGQDYARLKRHCDWAKPMTYRLAQGPAGLRLEIPALIAGVASRFGLDESRVVEWSARHAAFDGDMLRETRERAVPISFIQAEINAAVRTLAPVPCYFGLELVRQPGVIDVDEGHVVAMVKAGRAANAAGVVISWDLMHAPIDCVRALADAAQPD
ncbi:MAG: hypothetical protein JO288_14940 [Hyphomicrobiales bacterium]|nr:hypothetical protein [Hyphomicrobiales bacterium]